MHEPGWQPVRTGDGSWTLAHPVHAATCHSTSGAWQQARERYCAPCRIAELGRQRGIVRLLDFGTGLGLNLAAALAELAPSGARLEVVSLEHDPSVLRAALELVDWPSEVAPWHALVRSSLRACLAGPSNAPLGERGELRLLLGEAQVTLRELAAASCFDAVFFDPFAPQVEPQAWSRGIFELVANSMTPQAVLSTYSTALSVRVELARTGLRVGRGPRVGAKSAGTLASWRAPLPELDPRTRKRLEKRAPANP